MGVIIMQQMGKSTGKKTRKELVVMPDGGAIQQYPQMLPLVPTNNGTSHAPANLYW